MAKFGAISLVETENVLKEPFQRVGFKPATIAKVKAVL